MAWSKAICLLIVLASRMHIDDPSTFMKALHALQLPASLGWAYQLIGGGSLLVALWVLPMSRSPFLKGLVICTAAETLLIVSRGALWGLAMMEVHG